MKDTTMKNSSRLGLQFKTIVWSVVVLILAHLMGTDLFAKGPAAILKIKPELFQTSIARDVLSRNVNAKIKVIDTELEFTDRGLSCSATKEVRFFPDIPFSALIDISCPKANFIELNIREAKVIGVELKWLSSLVVSYLEDKISEGKLNSYFTISKKGWEKSSEKSSYSILLKLKPENIIKALENPVIVDVSVNKDGLILSVGADR